MDYNYDPYFSCKIGMWSLFKIFSNLSLNWPYSWILGWIFQKIQNIFEKVCKIVLNFAAEIPDFWYKNGSKFWENVV